jgi:FKBP-type peptidyl-prolyl cis-trans isomerase
MRKLVLAVSLLALPLFAAKPTTPPADLTTPPADATRLENGLVWQPVKAGTGTTKLTVEDIARMHLTVWKSDGKLVQHVEAPQTLEIPVSKMLPGWSLIAQEMVEGEQRRFWLPASLSGGKLKEGETLLMDMELIAIVPPPVAPPDVAAAPADATVTASGLAFKVLRPGTGEVSPRRNSSVTVHYSGWTTDGRMFDSSLVRGSAATFRLTEVIAGWTEGLQHMVVGEKTRFWIPSRLAYGNERGKPQGMLVFDIELLSVN